MYEHANLECAFFFSMNETLNIEEKMFFNIKKVFNRYYILCMLAGYITVNGTQFMAENIILNVDWK